MSVKGKQESKQARCPHCPQLLFSRSFKWQGCPVTSHSSFALVGAEGHHADPNPAALPLSSVAGDIFGFGHSLLPSSPWEPVLAFHIVSPITFLHALSSY